MLNYRSFFRMIDFRPIILPVDLHAGTNSGLWQPVRNYAAFGFIYFAAAGTASQDVTLTLQQATTAAGAGAKNLVGIQEIFQREHATALPSDWTVLTQTRAATWTSATGGESVELVGIQVDPADLDVAGGFDFVTINIADPGAGTGKEGSVLMWGARARYASDLPSAAA